MKASDLITLTTINRIFTEKATTDLKPMTKMVYINILTHHFQVLDATEQNMVAFEMFKEDLQYEKFQSFYRELHYSNLVTILQTSVLFNNVWGTYIDKKMFEVKPETDNTILGFKQELLSYDQMIDMVAMKHRMNKEKVLLLLDMFILEQGAIKTRYESLPECVRHFFNWSNIQAPKMVQKNNQTKILGLE